jgi:hypothetical protein
MDEFYDALAGELDEEFRQEFLPIVRGVFREQGICAKQLHRLTDEKLEKAGIAQIGLREAILVVLGK